MALCMIVGCANRSGRDNGVYFARFPSVVTNQGKEAENLSRERTSRCISAISRAILQTTFWRMTVFVEGTLFLVRLPKAGIGLTLTGFQHCV